MGYFPFFIELSDREGLIVGGGPVAARKVEKLLPYGPRLTVAASEITDEIARQSGLTLIRGPFVPEMLAGKAFVIAATDNRELNHEIAALCAAQQIPVNVVDDPEACTFLFPALVKRGDLSVGISTGGASPSAAVWLKEKIEAELPERFEEILDYLAAVRPEVKSVVPEARRGAVFARLFHRCMELERSLEPQELQEILEETP